MTLFCELGMDSNATCSDDLPVIRDNIKNGFLETQSTVNKWVKNLMNKIDGKEEDDGFTSPPARPAHNFQGGTHPYGRRSGDLRRSADRERYDADPEVIGDDFSRLELRDSEKNPVQRSHRPLANPDLFKAMPNPPGDRKVSFQQGSPEEIRNIYADSQKSAAVPEPVKRAPFAGKWQPLSAVDPSPIAEHDPFSLGDSDDDKDARLKDMKPDDVVPNTIDAERSQKATAEDREAIGEDIANHGKDPDMQVTGSKA